METTVQLKQLTGQLKLLLRKKQFSDLSIALDIEGVLAAEMNARALTLLNKQKNTTYSIDDLKDWGFKSINTPIPVMMALFDRVWTEQWKEMKCEGDPKTINELCGVWKNVDIVTSRTGVDVPLNNWLTLHRLQNIPLVIRPPTHEKTTLPYDIFIDDSPILASEVIKTNGRIQLLRKWPWNKNVPDHERIIRVGDVNEAAILLIKAVRKEKSAIREI